MVVIFSFGMLFDYKEITYCDKIILASTNINILLIPVRARRC